MANVFNEIFKLKLRNSGNPLEDFTSEILSGCLRSSLEFFNAFLNLLKIQEDFTKASISNQITFKALQNHKVASKPDIVIYFEDHVIFIESKIDAAERDSQLNRYAEQLQNLSHTQKSLIYLTRDFDPKIKEKVLENCPDVNFYPLRWYLIHELLSENSNDSLLEQFRLFMELKNLDSSRNFSPLDIMVLTNFSRVRRIMQEALSGRVSAHFKKVLGSINKDSSSMTQLRDHDRYINRSIKKNKVWVGYGFWLNSYNNEDYPNLKFVIEIGPSSPKYEDIKKVMGTIADSDRLWKSWNLQNPQSWAGICIEKSLKEIINNEDHILEIEEFFLECIKEYEKIKQTFAGLF